MFHLFTIDGKRLDLPYEKIRDNPRVNRIGRQYRARKHAGIEERAEGAGGEYGAGDYGGYGREAYRRAAREEPRTERVYRASEIMSSPVITIGPDLTATEAWNMFNEVGCRHMPVVSAEGATLGILSERDLLKQLIIRDGRVEDARDIPVRDIMSRDVIATAPSTDIRRVARIMLEQHVGMMPVVDEGGAIAGVVTRSDILHAIVHHPGFSLWA